MASFRFRLFILLLLTGAIGVALLYHLSSGGVGSAVTTHAPGDAETTVTTLRAERAESLRTSPVPLKHRLVHLDLKGAPPKVDFYGKLFPFLHQLNATGILIEYEDMFPYWGPLQPLAAGNAYSRQDISQIRTFARESNLMIVPLVQTFGHLEFALKLSEFSSLREVQHSPQALCPSRNESLALVTTMVEQVLALHPHIKYLHIGCDEVYDLGECPLCRVQDRDKLFLSHVRHVAGHVRAAGVRPIIWDDMFRSTAEEVIQQSGVAPLVDVMVWEYRPLLSQHLDRAIWPKYSRLFQGVWTATAFKGALSPRRLLPDAFYHLRNQRAWLETLRNNPLPLRGVVLTGWQRYDHFAALCELLPAGLPSLALGLTYLRHGHLEGEPAVKLQHALGCSRPPVAPLLEPRPPLLFCTFPGSKVHLGIQQLATVIEQKKIMLRDSHFEGWLSSYNRMHNFSSPFHVLEATKNLSEILVTVRHLQHALGEALPEVYDGNTVSEWMDTTLLPELKEVEALQVDAERLLARSTWPRRPLAPAKRETTYMP
ncbi:hexosaminidase D-like [Ornithodoros turicata]|uniref:hexosaminidase D-like n=1 Tax=Ornithodoros turicata TaxID=34597 RepID=UPI0031386B10